MSKSLDSTLGAPFAMLPAPGLYWSQKAAFASAQLVNGQGNDTGIHAVNRAPMDAPAGKRQDPEIVFAHLMEGIGLALDLKGGRMFITDFGGSVYRADLDGSNSKTLLFYQGNLTGIASAELPTT
jgi:hypothetical protein